MALLRQCLQAVRTKHHEWEAPDAAWPKAMPFDLFHRACARASLLPSRPCDIRVEPEPSGSGWRAIQN
jgi:hypothetical protein